MLWHDFADRLLAPDARLAEQLDAQRRIYRAAALVDGKLDGCLCVGPADSPPHWEALAALPLVDLPGATPGMRTRSLAQDLVETEAVICACFGVGLEAIRGAVACGTARTVGDVGRLLRAGTNCGSCLPELKRIIARERVARPN